MHFYFLCIKGILKAYLSKKEVRMAEIDTKKRFTEHKILLDNGNKLEITGVENVEVAIHSQFVCVVRGERLEILGHNLEVTNLNIDTGCVALSGEVKSINYVGEKKSLFRRIFK